MHILISPGTEIASFGSFFTSDINKFPIFIKVEKRKEERKSKREKEKGVSEI